MSKSTLALIAVLGASGGAAITAAAMLSLRPSSPSPSTSAPSTSSKPAATIATTTTASTTTPTQARPSLIPTPGLTALTPGTTSTPALVNPAGLFEYGFPGPISDLATRSAFISSFDRRTRNPYWTIEHITPASLACKGADRRHSTFIEDEAVPSKFRALLKDYYRSGYDRGHQVPAADAKWSQDAMDDTFFLTNMCPQVGEGFNRDYWAHFEDFCRRLTQRYPSVRIVTGPLYLPKKDAVDSKWYVKYEVIGTPANVAVPTHFYKVILAEEDGPDSKSGKVAIGAFVLPNARIPNEKPITDFEVPVEAVERASGLEFASKLSPERKKRLCADGVCQLVVRDFSDRQSSAERTLSPGR